MAVAKIVSGGQTGADRAALEAARARGVPIAGWVPRGRWAEDGRVPDELVELRETESRDPAERTRRNVADSDGTLIVSHGALSGGTALTRATAEQTGKPCLWIDLAARAPELARSDARAWLELHQVHVLNVAGARASEDVGIHDATFALVSALLDPTDPLGATPQLGAAASTAASVAAKYSSPARVRTTK